MRFINLKFLWCSQNNAMCIATNFILLSMFSTLVSCEEVNTQQLTDYEYFHKLERANWKEKFFSSGARNWEEKWFLDGASAKVTNTDEGMEFDAGSKGDKSNLNHAVLWTKESFKGDIKIEYEYTRLDSARKFTTILYVQATGSNHGMHDKDIYQWANLRSVPHMKLYFNHMNTYHISYAAYGPNGVNSENDYIRARRYLPET